MNNLKIKTFGWRNKQLDQISRIEDGFRILGHTIVESGDCDIVYSNNDFYDDILEFAAKQEKRPFVILNVLDLQVNNPLYDLNRLTKQLIQANAITCISKSVQKQILDNLLLRAEVIFNPLKDVELGYATGKENILLYVGRACDANKRFNLVKQTLEKVLFGEESLIVIGSENPRYGWYEGVVSDDILNEYYNTSKFLFLPSKFEGLGLTACEAMVCGCIPILCNDNPTAFEFAPPEFICDPNPDTILAKLFELNKSYQFYRAIALEWGRKHKENMNKVQVARNIISIYEKSKI